MKAWNELHLGWKDQTFTGDICGWWRGKERKIPQFDSILGPLCLVDEKKQEGSAVVLSPQETPDYWCFHKVVVFIVILQWHLCLENTTSPARAHTQGAQARRCCWLTLRTRQRDEYFGLCLWTVSQTMLMLQHWYPFSTQTPGTGLGDFIPCAYLLFHAGVSPHGTGMGWVSSSGTSVLQKGLFYWHKRKTARDGSRDFSSSALAGEQGRKVVLWLFCLWSHQPFSLGGCMGAVLGPPSSSLLGAAKASLCHIKAWAAGRGASCLFQLLWHFRNAGRSLKLHFKAFNPLVGCIPHAWTWPLQAGAAAEWHSWGELVSPS